jgi:hypothetical protein
MSRTAEEDSGCALYEVMAGITSRSGKEVFHTEEVWTTSEDEAERVVRTTLLIEKGEKLDWVGAWLAHKQPTIQ